MKSGGLLVLASQKWSRKRTDEKKEENEEENGRVQKKPMFPLRFINLNIYFLVCCSFSCLLLNLRTNFRLSVQCWFFIFFSHCVGVAFFFYCEYFCIETRIVWFHLVVAGSQKNSERERTPHTGNVVWNHSLLPFGTIQKRKHCAHHDSVCVNSPKSLALFCWLLHFISSTLVFLARLGSCMYIVKHTR